MKNLCIYHANCPDGRAAAAAVYRHWGEEAEYYPAQYQQEPPDVAGRNVIIVDFSYPREVLLEMKEQAKWLLVIDHHKTAQEALKGLDFCIFDNSKSGCVLTWEHLFEEPAPLLFKYIQDRDLWQWKLPDSKAFSAGLWLVDNDFEDWLLALQDEEDFIEECKSKGRVLLEYWDQCTEIAMKQTPQKINLGGYEVPCLNVTHLKSEICNELAKGQPFAVVYKDCVKKRVYELRSDVNGIDVSKIAIKYGGGGHKHAAGFVVCRPIHKLESQLKIDELQL